MSPEIEVMEILCLRVGEGVVGSRGGGSPVSDAVSVLESEVDGKICESPIHCLRPFDP